MRKLMLLTMLSLIVMPVAAQASGECPVPLSLGSAENPNLTDPANDWEGLVLGNGSATYPVGDVYREGTDIVSAWLARDAEGDMTANIQVADLGEVQPNAIFYFLWTYGTTEANGVEVEARRWASARMKGYTSAFSFGNLVPSSTLPTSTQTFRTEGDTTGTIDVAGDLLTIDLPRGGVSFLGESTDNWGAPEGGSVLLEPSAEARFLIGSPEPLPSNPAGLRHGYVYPADDSANADPVCDTIVD